MLARVLKKVYSRHAYLILAVLAFFLLPALSALATNWALLVAVGKPLFLIKLMMALPYMLGWVAFTYLIVTSLLFGINIGLAVFYFRISGRAHTSSLWALILSLLGLGCASCGSLLFLPFVGTFLVGGSFFLPIVIAQLPLVGIFILIWSIYTLAKKIDNPYI